MCSSASDDGSSSCSRHHGSRQCRRWRGKLLATRASSSWRAEVWCAWRHSLRFCPLQLAVHPKSECTRTQMLILNGAVLVL